MAQFKITEICTEYQKNPLGLDCDTPRISWKLEALDEKRQGLRQSAYQILVGSQKGAADLWDSGKTESADSIGVSYQGAKLAPCTRYYLTIRLWDEKGEYAEDTENWFETGFLNPDIAAWGGAKWIGAPEKYVSTKTMGVFVISSNIKLEQGSTRAGIVFGANDKRLMDARKNQYEIAGENYIRYVLNVEKIPAELEIYRVGYAPEDTAEKPFAAVPVVDFHKSREQGREALDYSIITEENRYEEHELKIEVIGDCAYAYVDGILCDAVEKKTFFGTSVEARQLNPLDFNDTTTFPRLCEIGYYVGAGDTAHFDGITVRNYRAPQNVVVAMDVENGGVNKTGIDETKQPAELQEVRDMSAHAIPMLRRDFSVDKEKELAGARLYMTARGIYDCRINGVEITDTWFNPGSSQYDKHIMYQTYDVTGLLQGGENGIAITLSSGWWCDSQTFVLRNYNYYGDQEAVLGRLEITYKDGTKESFVTNTTDWDYYGEGPYTYAGFFQGEHLDGRKKVVYDNFSKAGFTIEGMKKPVIVTPEVIESYSTMPAGFGRAWPKVDHSKTQIVGGVNAPITEVCRLVAKTRTEPREGLFIYDLEQEIAGVPYICFHGKAGTKVTIRYGEMLYPKLPEYGNLHGLMLTENYRDAESIDEYILSGAPEGEIYCPKFSFHGYRYIEISGIENPPEIAEVQSIQLSSVKEFTGKIETSEKLLNRFIENVRWSQLCNFISIPTDCPQRNERMGWAGDTHVFCRTATYQSDVRLFYYRYLEALRDLQEEDGQLPEIAPVGGGFGGITYQSAMILMVWELYQQYGDVDVIREYYAAMKKWCSFIRQKGMPGEAFVGPLGDWLAPEETDNSLLWNTFYAHDMELMAAMADILGKQKEAKEFKQLEQEAKQYWNEKFIDEATGKTKKSDGSINDTQCSYALPLAYHMFSGENETKAYEHLARKTKEVGYTVSTGFFGTGVLNPMLSKGGYTDMAYHLMLQTAYPSWLYPVTQGATTIWERWNSYTVENGFGGNNSMNSFNHYSLGSVLSWIYEEVLGIKRDEKIPGYGHFTLEPAMMALDYAKGCIKTGYGLIESSWKKEKDGYLYECRIPANTTATIRLKNTAGIATEKECGSGQYVFHISD